MKIVVNTEKLLTEIPTSVSRHHEIPAFSMSSGSDPSTLFMFSEAIPLSSSLIILSANQLIFTSTCQI